jgi:hypothetical protein
MGAGVGHADSGDDGWRVDTGVERAIGGGGAEGVGGRRGRAGCRRRRGLGGGTKDGGWRRSGWRQRNDDSGFPRAAAALLHICEKKSSPRLCDGGAGRE